MLSVKFKLTSSLLMTPSPSISKISISSYISRLSILYLCPNYSSKHKTSLNYAWVITRPEFCCVEHKVVNPIFMSKLGIENIYFFIVENSTSNYKRCSNTLIKLLNVSG